MKALSFVFFMLTATQGALNAQEISVLKSEELDRRWLPDSAITQHASYAGYAAIGFGYQWHYGALDVLYGFTPKSLAGIDVQSWSIKTSGYLGRWRASEQFMLKPYGGVSIIYSPDQDLFVRLPKQYPKAYYPPSAIRPALLSGLELQIAKTVGIGVEFALLDSELAYLRDAHQIDPEKVGSSGFTVRWLF
jgi:hypothetical protein